MGRHERVIGGESNEKSGQAWTKDELLQVYQLFKEMNGEGLHENNPKIQQLAKILNRTTRSAEAQLLMYRNLQRGGNYSHGNMSKICKEIWLNSEKKESNIMAVDYPSFPKGLFEWAGHKKGGVKKPFDAASGRPNGKVIETSLTKKIQEWVVSFDTNSPRIILLVGGPGNGKTDSLEYLIDQIDEKYQTNYYESISELIKLNGDLIQRNISIPLKQGPFKDNELIIVQDASTGSDNISCEQCLINDLEYSLNRNSIYIVCVNRGILAEAVNLAETSNERIYKILSRIIQSLTKFIVPLPLWPLDNEDPILRKIAVWPMDVESLVKPQEHLHTTPGFQLISEAVREDRWKCSTCTVNKELCPFFQNKTALQDIDKLKSLLQLLSDFEIISNKRWTFRELFSLTSYLIVGSEHEYGKKDLCEWVKGKQLLLNGQEIKERIKSIWDFNRCLYHFKLFSKWPSFISISRSNKTEIKTILNFSILTKELFAYFTNIISKRDYKPDIAQILDNLFFENIDPSQFSNEDYTIPEINCSLREIEADFSFSVDAGYDLIKAHLNPIERMLFENLIEVEKDLDTKSRFETSISTKRIDEILVLLRSVSIRYFKRIVFTGLGISKDENYLSEFRKLNLIDDGRQLKLKQVRDLFDNLIQGSNGLSLVLNSSISQPQMVSENQISIDLRRLQIKHSYIIDSIIDVPRNNVRVFIIDFKDKYYIVLTYQLYKALIQLNDGLSPSSLHQEVLSMLDSIKSKLAGIIVRDVDILQNAKLIIGNSLIHYRIDDSSQHLEINKIQSKI
jgi:hypothetical protein